MLDQVFAESHANVMFDPNGNEVDAKVQDSWDVEDPEQILQRFPSGAIGAEVPVTARHMKRYLLVFLYIGT